jgi:hypothetical protein
MNIEGITSVFILAFSVSAISLTITKAQIFGWLRERLQGSKWLGGVIECSYCTSHWLAFALVAYYQPVVVKSQVLLIDLAVSAFVVVGIATMVSWLVYNSYKKLDVEGPMVQQLRQALQKAQAKIAEQEQRLK